MKRNFLILAMFLFAFSMGYAANGNEEFLKANEYYEKNDVSAEIELGTTYFYQKKYDLAEKAYVSALNKIKDKKELSDNVKR